MCLCVCALSLLHGCGFVFIFLSEINSCANFKRLYFKRRSACLHATSPPWWSPVRTERRRPQTTRICLCIIKRSQPCENPRTRQSLRVCMCNLHIIREIKYRLRGMPHAGNENDVLYDASRAHSANVDADYAHRDARQCSIWYIAIASVLRRYASANARITGCKYAHTVRILFFTLPERDDGVYSNFNATQSN